ncbi:MAG: GNAT family N-acetyltransferase [Desulfopila sp.]
MNSAAIPTCSATSLLKSPAPWYNFVGVSVVLSVVHIRPAGQRDIAAIEALEHCAPSAWSTASIAAEIMTPNGCSLVAASGCSTEIQNTEIQNTEIQSNEIYGWCCIRCTPPEAELLKIAVHPCRRRKTWGRLLLQEAFGYAAAHHCTTVFLEVRSNNHSARRLYAKCGMKEHAVRKQYYTHPADDAIIYQVTFPAVSTTPSVEEYNRHADHQRYRDRR